MPSNNPMLGRLRKNKGWKNVPLDRLIICANFFFIEGYKQPNMYRKTSTLCRYRITSKFDIKQYVGVLIIDVIFRSYTKQHSVIQ